MRTYFSNLLAALVGADRRIETKLDTLLKGQKDMATALDDLTKAVGRVATDIKTIAATLAGEVSASDIEAQVTALNSAADTLETAAGVKPATGA